MNKYSYLSLIFTGALLSMSQLVQAKSISVTVVGSGGVKAKEADISCTESCILTNTLSKNTLAPTANSGWEFSGWSGQQCDSGSQVLVNTSYKSLGGASGGAKTLKTVDLNGDNLDDLVSISLFNGEVSLRNNQGNGQFNTINIDTNLHYPTALDLYDWDGDSDFDLFVAEYGRGVIKVYLNDGLGDFTFSEDIKISDETPYSFKILDKNNDGQPDIILSSFSADITGDLLVLVKSISAPKTQWFINNNGRYVAEELLSSFASMTIDAYRKDNVVSVVTAEIENDEVAQYRSGSRTVVDIGNATYGAAFGDIDKDGNMDVLAAHYIPSTLNLVYGKDDGSFTTAQLIFSPENGVTATSFGDYNNDGYLDIATGEFNKKLFYYFVTNSYKDCVISSEGDVSLVATFVESIENSPTNNSSEKTIDQPKKESSGGSFYYPLLLLSLLFRMIRKKD